MKKKKKDIIPVSNYVKLILVIIVVVLGVFALRNIYLSNEDYNNSIPVIRDSVVREINSKEVYNYVREDNDAIIYVGVADNKLCRKYEEELKKIIKKYFLEEEITYLNLTDLKSTKSFIKEFNKFYDSKLKDYPSIIIFKDGKVVDIFTVSDENNMYQKTIDFLLDNEIPLNEGD